MRMRLPILLGVIGIVAVLGSIILLRAATSTVAAHVGERCGLDRRRAYPGS